VITGLLARKDNIIIFITQDEDPCDDGLCILANDKVFPIKDAWNPCDSWKKS